MENELMNAVNMDATQRGEVNEQYQNVIELIVQKYPITFSTIH